MFSKNTVFLRYLTEAIFKRRTVFFGSTVVSSEKSLVSKPCLDTTFFDSTVFGSAFHLLVGLPNLQGFVERVQQFSVQGFRMFPSTPPVSFF
jgi:hypothetical protein